MKTHIRRRVPPAPFLLAAGCALALAGCESVTTDFGRSAPNVSGLWSGQYVVTGCSLTSASDDMFCSEAFPIRASLILETDLEQDGDQVFGVLGQGSLIGDVDGVLDDFGVLSLGGILGSDTSITSEILAWSTGVVDDSLVGSWRFEVIDHSNGGFGVAIVDANMRLLGPTVLKLFGCPVETELLANNQVSGNLNVGDCEFADASLFDLYSFRGSAGDSIEIALRSPAFDAFLLVADVDENELGSDDDSGGGGAGTDAALTLVFDVSGTVLLAANSLTAGQSGPYTLSATRLGTQVAGPARAGRGRGVRVIEPLGGQQPKARGPKLERRFLRIDSRSRR